jgi:hypothetical protein
MRWAYRRIALLGLAVDFIYRGEITKPQKLLHVLPLGDEDVFDSGWGYIGTPTDIRIDDRRLLWLIGTARLMPASVLQWMVDEAPNRFLRGEVFVAPAELVGISQSIGEDLIDAMADVLRGAVLTEDQRVAGALFDIELPFIEGMSPEDFEKLLEDEQDSLHDFRSAFYDITRRYHNSEVETRVALERLRDEISAIKTSARTARLRNFVERCKGRMSLFNIGMGTLAAGDAIYTKDPLLATMVAAGAGKVLYDLWKESAGTQPDLRSRPLRLLWKLGATTSRQCTRRTKSAFPTTKVEPAKEIDPHHWLCPPTAGIGLAFVRKENA